MTLQNHGVFGRFCPFSKAFEGAFFVSEFLSDGIVHIATLSAEASEPLPLSFTFLGKLSAKGSAGDGTPLLGERRQKISQSFHPNG